VLAGENCLAISAAIFACATPPSPWRAQGAASGQVEYRRVTGADTRRKRWKALLSGTPSSIPRQRGELDQRCQCNRIAFARQQNVAAEISSIWRARLYWSKPKPEEWRLFGTPLSQQTSGVQEVGGGRCSAYRSIEVQAESGAWAAAYAARETQAMRPLACVAPGSLIGTGKSWKNTACSRADDMWCMTQRQMTFSNIPMMYRLDQDGHATMRGFNWSARRSGFHRLSMRLSRQRMFMPTRLI